MSHNTGCDMSLKNAKVREISNCLTARYDSGVTDKQAEGTAVIAIPEKRQNGRRFKENGEPSFTLTAQDKHGVADGLYLNDSPRFFRGSLKNTSRCLKANSSDVGVVVGCIGSSQKHAAKTDGTYSPTLTSAMGTGGGHTPMINLQNL